jgi:hypothetical protein
MPYEWIEVAGRFQPVAATRIAAACGSTPSFTYARGASALCVRSWKAAGGARSPKSQRTRFSTKHAHGATCLPVALSA